VSVEKNAENFHQKAKLSPHTKKRRLRAFFFSRSLSLGKEGRDTTNLGGEIAKEVSAVAASVLLPLVCFSRAVVRVGCFFFGEYVKRGENERSGDAVAIDCFTATAVAPVDVFVVFVFVVVVLDEERDARKERRKRR